MKTWSSDNDYTPGIQQNGGNTPPSASTHLLHPGLYLAFRPQLLMLKNSKVTASVSKNDFSESAKMKYSIDF